MRSISSSRGSTFEIHPERGHIIIRARHLGDHMHDHLRRSGPIVLALCLLLVVARTPAQVAGSTVIGVAAAELREVATGWSAKHQILGQPVFNDKSERIGTIDDIIIAPDKAVSYAIVGAGGFLGVARHDVAIPVNQLKLVGTKFVLPGGTKEALKATPAFKYAPTPK